MQVGSPPAYAAPARVQDVRNETADVDVPDVWLDPPERPGSARTAPSRGGLELDTAYATSLC
jgi:hypothetical protein